MGRGRRGGATGSVFPTLSIRPHEHGEEKGAQLTHSQLQEPKATLGHDITMLACPGAVSIANPLVGGGPDSPWFRAPPHQFSSQGEGIVGGLVTSGETWALFVLSLKVGHLQARRVTPDALTLWAAQIPLPCPKTVLFTSSYLIVGGCSSDTSSPGAFSNHEASALPTAWDHAWPRAGEGTN